MYHVFMTLAIAKQQINSVCCRLEKDIRFNYAVIRCTKLISVRQKPFLLCWRAVFIAVQDH